MKNDDPKSFSGVKISLRFSSPQEKGKKSWDENFL
jgi:hypothetical protein